MRKQGIDPRLLLALLALVLVAGGVALLSVGGSSGNRPRTKCRAKRENRLRRRRDAHAGQAAPPLALRNYLGQPVNIASYRGKAVLVTFLYTHCPDVCPLITSNLRVAQNLMGAAKARQSADHRRLRRPARGHQEGDRIVPRKARDDRSYAVPGRLGARTGRGLEGVGRGLRTRRQAARIRQPLGPDLRHHRLGPAADDLRRELSPQRHRPRRARCWPHARRSR